MERSKIAINIARITRINKNLNYLLGFETPDEFMITALDPEFQNIGLWALEIQAYWKEHMDSNIEEQIGLIGSSANFYKLLLSAKMADELRGAISLYVDTMAALRKEIKEHKAQLKGSYALLPDELANEEAAKLLQRAIDADYLTEQYQPCSHVSKAQLMFLAFGIGKALKLKYHWKPFELLWNTTDLRGVYIPLFKIVELKEIIKLYPEVEFNQISNNPNVRDTISNLLSKQIAQPGDFKIENPDSAHYNSKEEPDKLLKLYYRLKQNKCISDDTTPEQWLYMCTGGQQYKGHCSFIRWNCEQNKLLLMIEKLFKENGEDKVWITAVRSFLIMKNNEYVRIKHDHLRVYYSRFIDKKYDSDSKRIRQFKDEVLSVLEEKEE